MREIFYKYLLGLALSASFVSVISADETMPFGGEADVALAAEIWTALEDAHMVGADRINVQPFEGNPPHGGIQQVLDYVITAGGREARVIVKANHGAPENETQPGVADVFADPNKWLGAYTVAFKREEGYDPDNADWFWAKYKPDGTLDQTPDGTKIAGQFMKGSEMGCIACHEKAGDDRLFLQQE